MSAATGPSTGSRLVPGGAASSPPEARQSPRPEGPSKAPGIVYTFYSFKGGVGRSMALANVAALLCKWGHDVLVVDWDLEAPGIEKYFERRPFRPMSSVKGNRDRRLGVLDLLEARVSGTSPDWRKGRLEVQFGDLQTPGRLDILSAGRRDATYDERVHDLSWPSLFNEEHDVGSYLIELRDDWKAEYDFVLIDSRTGINDIGGICTILLPDTLVLFFTTSEQSLEGALDVAKAARAGQERLDLDRTFLHVVPVPARDESQGAYKESIAWRERFATDLAELYEDWIPVGVKPKELVDKLKIPYWAVWSFGERLPVIEEPEEIGDPSSISAYYARLARLLERRLDWHEADGGSSVELASIQRARHEAERNAARSQRRSLISQIVAAMAFVSVAWILIWDSGPHGSPILDAVEAARDPTTQALLLLELAGESEPRGGLDLARSVALNLQPSRSLLGHSGPVTTVAFDPAGEFVVTGGQDNRALVWDAQAADLLAAVVQSDWVRQVRVSSSRWVLIVDIGGDATLWDPATQESRRLSCPECEVLGGIQAGAFFPDGRSVVTTSPSRIDVWHVQTGERITSVELEAADGSLAAGTGTWGLEVGPDGRYAVTFGPGRPILVLELTTGAYAETVSPDGSTVRSIAVANSSFAAGTEAGAVWMWSIIEPGSERRRQSPSATTLAVGAPRPLLGHQGAVNDVAFSPDGDHLASGGADGTLRIWRLALSSSSDAAAAEVTRPHAGNAVNIVAWGPNRDSTATGGADGTVAITRLSSSTARLLVADSLAQELPALDAFRNQAVFSPVLGSHRGAVLDVKYAPDGRSLASAAADSTARLWTLVTQGIRDSLRVYNWDQILSYLQSSTNACLTVLQRQRLLEESADAAQERFARCEERQGRGGTTIMSP